VKTRSLAVAALAATALLARAGEPSSPDGEPHARHAPDDPLFAEQWPLAGAHPAGANVAVDADVNAPEAWAYTLGSPGVLIAVLDDGVQLDHPDLAANIAHPGMDFTVDPPTIGAAPQTAADRHGTSVAGIAAARGDNGVGISGVCPRCQILPVRVIGRSDGATAAAFRYAVEQGADVITSSWGYTRPAGADPASDAIAAAARGGRDGRGTVIVFGAPNENADFCRAPHADVASLDSVLAVAVANHRGEVGGAGYGACLDLVAPAKPRDAGTLGVTTTDRTGLDGHTDGDYVATFGGTSAAAPLVAGIAGLLLSLNPDLTREDVVRILEHTAEKIDPESAHYDSTGFSERAGYGRVDAARAVLPTVTIEVVPARVAPGEPFAVTVSATAPFGVAALSWSGVATGDASVDSAHRVASAGAKWRTATWRDLTLATPGAYAFAADAESVPDERAPPGYPQRASAATAPAVAKLTVVERSEALPR
jgi:subtilisin family serine protease